VDNFAAVQVCAHKMSAPTFVAKVNTMKISLKRDTVSPRATNQRAASTRGPVRVNGRVVIGCALIAVCAVGSWGLYRANSPSHSVLVASRLLVEGEQLSSSDFRIEEVPAGAFTSGYVSSPDNVIGKVVTRVMHPGEVVPTASVGEVSETLQTTVVIDVSSAVASSLDEGSIVDVWAAASPRSSNPELTHEPPHAVVHRARLASKHDSTGGVSTGERVEIVLPRDAVADVLAAVARGDAMTVVASSGGLSS